MTWPIFLHASLRMEQRAAALGCCCKDGVAITGDAAGVGAVRRRCE
ncbi:hypothetical protein PG5_03780 [Pseudomonas sp. G5(2012)]|nr:hypothetical protein PG5_03780 [Pseudomonas sp. G5(2012)]